MEHSELFTLANRYWWLIFPVGWGIASLVGSWMRHRRAERALEILGSYASQNKEPPPEVLAMLQPQSRPERGPAKPQHFWGGGFFFSALAIAFAVLTVGNTGGNNDPDVFWGLLFVTVLMAGFAVGLLVTGWIAAQNQKNDQKTLPPA